MTLAPAVQDQVIDFLAGAQEFTYPCTIVEQTGKNIDADTVQVALVPQQPTAGDWRTPEINTPGTQLALNGTVLHTRTVQMMVGGPGLVPATGTYWLWYRVTDNPEVIPRRTNLRVTVQA